MADVLIRDVPDATLLAIDVQAKRLGLSRSSYLRRALDREANRHAGSVTSESLRSVAALVADLADPDVMGQAWT